MGINKNNPSEALDVNGNVHTSGTIKSGSSITIDGTDGTNDKITATSNLNFEVGGARALRLETNAESPIVIGGFSGNNVTAGVKGATISGGGKNTSENSVTSDFGTIGGGQGNTAGNGATVSGGQLNTAETNSATVGGGLSNHAKLAHSTVGGGANNSAIGTYSTIPGGSDNATFGQYSFAAGRRAKANHTGAFVWADGTDQDFDSTGDNQFLIRASGGVGIGTTNPAQQLDVVGNVHVTGTVESTGSGFKFPDGTVQTTAAAGDGHSLDAADGNPADVVFVDNDGKVGIGTTSPGYALDVDTGTVRADRYRMDDNKLSALYTDDGSHLQVGSRASGSTVGLQSGDDNDALFVASNGNVGIGTTSPDVPLHIANGSDVTGTGGGRFLLGSATGSGLRMDGNEIQAFTSGTSEDATLFLQHEGDGNVDLVDETLYVKSDGKVGIGTTAPQAKLDIRVNSSTSFPHLILVENEPFEFARLTFRDLSSGFWTLAGRGTGLFGSDADSEFNLFYNNFGNVWTARGNGNIGIGTSSPAAKLHIKQSSNSPTGGIRLENPNGQYWETYSEHSRGIVTNHYHFAYNGTLLALITGSDGAYNQISDRKLKKNIRQLEPVLHRVLQLSPSRYQFKDSPASTPASIGFIAQEVEPLFPEFVSESDGTKALAYKNFGVIAIKAIQEQQELIKALQQRIEDLEARLK